MCDVTQQLFIMAAESDVSCEIEVLQSIYLDDLTVTRNNHGGWRVSVILHPSTGEDCLAQYVRLTLTLDLDSEYPSAPPRVSIHHPRGLSDDKLLSLQRSLHSEAEECVGTPVLYQLIEKAKEILTESNIPHGHCVICLYGFKEGDVFTKTSCYHYFHSHCLGRYITHSEAELQERVRELQEDKTRDGGEEAELCVVCPVCREPLMYDLNTLITSPVPNYPQQEDEAVISEFKRNWAELQKIQDHQRERGGVIDPEAEWNRFLIHITPAPSGSSDPTCSDTLDPGSAPPLTPPSPPPPLPHTENPCPPQVENTSHRHAPRSRRWEAEFSGVRRDRGKKGGRGRGGRGGREPHVFPLPVLENLAMLNVSSSSPQDSGEHTEGHLGEVKEQMRQALGDERGVTRHNETPGLKHQQQIGARERGARYERDRGRRHGPRGPPYNQWHERNTQWENCGNVHHHQYSGARGHRAMQHRGNGKNWHQKNESEVRKEGVL